MTDNVWSMDYKNFSVTHTVIDLQIIFFVTFSNKISTYDRTSPSPLPLT